VARRIVPAIATAATRPIVCAATTAVNNAHGPVSEPRAITRTTIDAQMAATP